VNRHEAQMFEKRLAAIEQAILELAATFREAGVVSEGVGSLPSPSESTTPAPPNADVASDS